ncbi:MAG: hypothetical protein J2P15_13125 [Micromonosporaceae bacterium]|nr:hypothetical protein [Micromonosporaceae bacterium]
MPDETVRLQFIPVDERQREVELLARLKTGIEDLELGPVGVEHAPPDPETMGPGLIAWVTVVLAAGRGLRDLLKVAADWARRANNPVRVRIGDDELVLSHATSDQQDRLVEAFVRRHSAD